MQIDFWGVGQRLLVRTIAQSKIKPTQTAAGFLLHIHTYNQMAQFNSKPNNNNLIHLEQQIIREYKRLSFGQPSLLHNFAPIPYSVLPEGVSEDLRHRCSKCIILSHCSFFEVITFSVMEHIFSSQPREEEEWLNKLKQKICDQNFLFGSGTIKGLLIKGLQRMKQKQNQIDLPLANWLKEMEGLDAFTEFWKEIIEQESGGEVETFSTHPEPMYFKYVANFIGLGFILRITSQGLPQQMIITPSSFPQEGHFFTILIKDPQQTANHNVINEEESKPIQYMILLEKNRQKSQESLGQMQVPKYFSENSRRKEELMALKAKSWEVKHKGRELLRQFKQFYAFINDC